MTISFSFLTKEKLKKYKVHVPKFIAYVNLDQEKSTFIASFTTFVLCGFFNRLQDL